MLLLICNKYNNYYCVFYRRRNGNCHPYQMNSSMPIPCDSMFRHGADFVYVPFTRMNQTYVQTYIATSLVNTLKKLKVTSQCSNAITKALCVHYFLPCGNSSSIQVPQFLCPDTCRYIADDLCSNIWDELRKRIRPEPFNNVAFYLPVCDNTSMVIAPLNLSNDCCSSGGVKKPWESVSATIYTSKSDNPPLQLPTQTPPGHNSNIIGASVGGGIAVLVVTTALLFLVALLLFWRKKREHTRDLRLVLNMQLHKS